MTLHKIVPLKKIEEQADDPAPLVGDIKRIFSLINNTNQSSISSEIHFSTIQQYSHSSLALKNMSPRLTHSRPQLQHAFKVHIHHQRLQVHLSNNLFMIFMILISCVSKLLSQVEMDNLHPYY